MGDCLSRLARSKSTSKLLTSPREIRDNIYDKIPRDLQIDWLWNTQGYTDTRYATFDVIKVSFHNAPEPGVLAECTRLYNEMLEQDQLQKNALSVSITMMTRVTRMLSTIQVKVQQDKEITTRARIRTAFRNAQHATLCIQHLTPGPPWGPSSTTRLLQWTFLGMP